MLSTVVLRWVVHLSISVRVVSPPKFACLIFLFLWQLHHVGAVFSQTIAPVTYMWQPQQCRNTDTKVDHANICDEQEKVDGHSSLRRLWVWIHAAAFREGYNALQNACERQVE